MTYFGTRDGLQFAVRWRNDYGTQGPGPVGATWGDLRISVRDTVIWGSLGDDDGIKPITWSWIELLEFLGPAWRYLRYEQGYPIDFGHYRNEPEHPGQFRKAVESRWDAFERKDIYREDGLMRDFLLVHDLAQGLRGAYPPSFLLLRQGKQMIAATEDRSWHLDLSATLDTLTNFGQAVYQRIAGLDDQRSKIARERWEERDQVDSKSRFALISGWDDELMTEAIPDAANDSEFLEEYAIAARMLGSRVNPQQAKAILEEIHKLPKGSRPKLDELWEECASLMNGKYGWLPAQQGYALAAGLREYLDLSTEQPVEPEELLSKWGVAVHDFPIPEALIDAIAVWGPNHGPAILINPDGPRSEKAPGRRSTLAHEIAHLLVDYATTLPVIEVLGGRVPKSVEQRANAFAAELLLPRAVAAKVVTEALKGVFDQTQRSIRLQEAIDGLCKKYGTSYETTAWQIRNSSRLSGADHLMLERFFKSIHAPFSVNE